MPAIPRSFLLTTVLCSIIAIAPAMPVARAADEPATRPAVDLDNPASVAALLKSLGSERFTQRQSAQSVLDQVPVTQIQQLRHLAAQQTDPEITARLQRRIDAIQHYLEVNPLPITLDVQAVALDNLASALGNATGTPISATPLKDGAHFTLQTHDAAYWDTMQSLWQQHPFWFGDQTTTLQEGAPPAHLVVHEAACIGISDFTATPAPRGPVTYAADFAIAMDPRIALLRVGAGLTPQLTLTDARGNALAAKIDRFTGTLFNRVARPVIINGPTGRGTLTFTTADKPNTATINGTLTLRIITAEKQTVIEDAGKHLHQSFSIASDAGTITATLNELTLTKVDDPKAPQSLNVSIQILGDYVPGDVTNLPKLVLVRLFDANGKLVWTGEHDNRMAAAGIFDPKVPGTFAQPLKLMLSVPTLREWTIPFAFKDLPVK